MTTPSNPPAQTTQTQTGTAAPNLGDTATTAAQEGATAAEAQATATAAQEGAAVAPQAGQLVPIPVPIIENNDVNAGQAAAALLAFTLGAVLLRFLWRLPEILARSGVALIDQLGGPHAVQNHTLRGLGYLSAVGGLLSGNLLGGLVLAVLFAILVNLRPQD